jgi:hypothetical protein
MKNHSDETHKLEEEITAILRESLVRLERSPRHCETTDVNTSPPSHVSNICTNSPHSKHSNYSSSTSSSSLIKAIIDADKELLQNQPYLSTDHTPTIETSADMYYDQDWHYPDTELEKHMYSLTYCNLIFNLDITHHITFCGSKFWQRSQCHK